MTIFPKRPSLSKPRTGEQIPIFNLGYVRARNKNRAHSLLLTMFRDSGLKRSDLAAMLGKKPEQITRWLSGPGNLTLDTLSDLIFALKGEFFEVRGVDELAKPKSNCGSPLWLRPGRGDDPQSTSYITASGSDRSGVTIFAHIDNQKGARYEHR